jgi:hypothetical protein
MIITNITQNQSLKLRAFVYNLMDIIPPTGTNLNEKVSIRSRVGSALSSVTYGDVVSIQNDESITRLKIVK